MIFDVAADMTYRFAEPSDVLLLIEAADGQGQSVVSESLDIAPAEDVTRRSDDIGGRRTVFRAHGDVRIAYRAAVERPDSPLDDDDRSVLPLRDLPSEALPWLWASRYCPSDRFEGFVERTFGGLKDKALVDGVLDWVFDNVEYRRGVSSWTHTAVDTMLDRAGVCRDFTHLTIALLRAAGVPARAVSAYAWTLEPPDMHAVVEAFIGGRWRLIDPTRRAPVEGLIRVATGADAAHIAFMSVYGRAQMLDLAFSISRRD